VKVLHQRQRIDAAGSALFIAFDTPERLHGSLLEGLEVPYPILVDRDRRAYQAWGLERGSVLGIWGDPRVWARYGRALAGGVRLRRPGTDTLQLGGDFVVDPAGTVVYARPQQRDDRPPVAELVRTLERATSAPR
jgi:hypothetical protein